MDSGDNMTKKILITASLAFIVPLIVLSFFLSRSPSQDIPTVFPTPTILPEKIIIKKQEQTIDYAPEAANRLVEKMESAILSQEAQKIKDVLESKALLHNGVISSSTLYIMRYIFAFDLVQIEIITTDTINAKKTAVEWLRSQGLDEKSICDLPVMFYLTAEVKDQMSSSTEPFDYLPEGCI
jgi:hypothetical protein